MRWQAQFTDGSQILAVLCCPNGHAGSLDSKVHQIGPGGVVSPSYVCTHPGCGFHTFISLDRWANPSML